MKAKFKARPYRVNKQLFYRFLYIISYLLLSAGIFYLTTFWGVIFLFPGFIALLSVSLSGIRYFITDDYLLIKRPILYKKKILYTDIKKVEQLSAEQALAQVQQVYKQYKSNNYSAKLFTDLTLLATTGTIYPPGEPSRTETTFMGKTTVKYGNAYQGYAEGDFILLTINDDGNVYYLFLTPLDFYGFYSALRSKI